LTIAGGNKTTERDRVFKNWRYNFLGANLLIFNCAGSVFLRSAIDSSPFWAWGLT
jgi:hypothetical protein